ncbi:MAG: sigma-70 family RNA polymerase sigma factor [Thermoguttaceae bacterium]|jgi:RNA polymerase sigma-70 factor (ECF subfamily)
MTTQYAAIPQTDNPLAETVYAAQRGDRQAFGRLIANFERAVYATAYRRLNNHADAQELCQDVFLQAMRKIDQLEDPRCFGGWLRSIADRMAINRLMRRGPCTSADTDMLNSDRVELRTPLVVLLEREREDQVRRGLRRLRRMDRETLVAFYFDGRSINEMSQKFQTPVGTIKRRLHVARKRLAKELETLSPA